jgi:hypothetical protein
MRKVGESLELDGYDVFQITFPVFASRYEKIMKYVSRSLVPGMELDQDSPEYKCRALSLYQYTSSGM